MALANYDFLCAKIRGLRRSLYERERLARLCEIPGLQELLRSLYPDRQIGEHIALERALTETHIAELARIYKQLEGSAREFYLWLLRHYQLENLKLIFRCWSNREPQSVASRYLPQVPRLIELPVDELLNAASVGAFAEAVPEPIFRKALQGLSGEAERPEEVYPGEAALDRAYYAELRAKLERLPPRHRLPVRPMVRFHIAIYDILLLVRGRLNYSVSFAELLEPMVAAEELFERRRAERVAEAQDLEQILAALPKRLKISPVSGRQFQHLERVLWERLYRLANRTFYTSLYDLGTVVAFYYVKRIELANLIRVVELVRLGVRPDQVRAQMIPPLA